MWVLPAPVRRARTRTRPVRRMRQKNLHRVPAAARRPGRKREAGLSAAVPRRGPIPAQNAIRPPGRTANRLPSARPEYARSVPLARTGKAGDGMGPESLPSPHASTRRRGPLCRGLAWPGHWGKPVQLPVIADPGRCFSRVQPSTSWPVGNGRARTPGWVTLRITVLPPYHIS